MARRRPRTARRAYTPTPPCPLAAISPSSLLRKSSSFLLSPCFSRPRSRPLRGRAPPPRRPPPPREALAQAAQGLQVGKALRPRRRPRGLRAALRFRIPEDRLPLREERAPHPLLGRRQARPRRRGLRSQGRRDAGGGYPAAVHGAHEQVPRLALPARALPGRKAAGRVEVVHVRAGGGLRRGAQEEGRPQRGRRPALRRLGLGARRDPVLGGAARERRAEGPLRARRTGHAALRRTDAQASAGTGGTTDTAVSLTAASAETTGTPPRSALTTRDQSEIEGSKRNFRRSFVHER